MSSGAGFNCTWPDSIFLHWIQSSVYRLTQCLWIFYSLLLYICLHCFAHKSPKKKKKKLHPVSGSITYKSIILHSKARIWGRKNKNKKSGDCISGSTPLLHTRLEPLSLYKEARGKRDEQVDLYCVESNSPFAQLCSATLNPTEIKGLYLSALF